MPAPTLVGVHVGEHVAEATVTRRNTSNFPASFPRRASKSEMRDSCWWWEVPESALERNERTNGRERKRQINPASYPTQNTQVWSACGHSVAEHHKGSPPTKALVSTATSETRDRAGSSGEKTPRGRPPQTSWGSTVATVLRQPWETAKLTEPTKPRISTPEKRILLFLNVIFFLQRRTQMNRMH